MWTTTLLSACFTGGGWRRLFRPGSPCGCVRGLRGPTTCTSGGSEVFVPLRHDPGHAQVDFGEALAVIGGAERKIHFFAMDLPHSDGCVVQAYPAETTEAFCEGHNVSFEFFGGPLRSILYDNTKLVVARILGDGRRQRTRTFSELRSRLQHISATHRTSPDTTRDDTPRSSLSPSLNLTLE
jgi:transposase